VSVARVATAGERGTCLEVLRPGHDLVDVGTDLLRYDLNSVADGELSRGNGVPNVMMSAG